MELYQIRLIKEYTELNTKLVGLLGIIADYRGGLLDFEPNCSVELLVEQSRVMINYLDILSRRINIEILYPAEDNLSMLSQEQCTEDGTGMECVV